MINIPRDILTRFQAMLVKRVVPTAQHSYYKKWLRFYLDFCFKYEMKDSNKESLWQFIAELRKKNQTSDQQEQAAHAISYVLPASPDIRQNGVAGQYEAEQRKVEAW